eukprot:7383312-Prymnesium_polylepis.1
MRRYVRWNELLESSTRSSVRAFGVRPVAKPPSVVRREPPSSLRRAPGWGGRPTANLLARVEDDLTARAGALGDPLAQQSPLRLPLVVPLSHAHERRRREAAMSPTGPRHTRAATPTPNPIAPR